MQGPKIPHRLNNVLVVIAVMFCLLGALRIRHGGGAAWFVLLGLSGYFIVAGLYQILFKR